MPLLFTKHSPCWRHLTFGDQPGRGCRMGSACELAHNKLELHPYTKPSCIWPIACPACGPGVPRKENRGFAFLIHGTLRSLSVHPFQTHTHHRSLQASQMQALVRKRSTGTASFPKGRPCITSDTGKRQKNEGHESSTHGQTVIVSKVSSRRSATVGAMPAGRIQPG
eukprot:scaffold11413_cov18-Tisochrysis_lutea.AAC.1